LCGEVVPAGMPDSARSMDRIAAPERQ
jgi:hypothetical protein